MARRPKSVGTHLARNEQHPKHLRLSPPEWIDAWKGQAETELPLTWEDPDNMYKPIPRKPEIEEKNALTVAKSLEIIRNNMTKSLY